MTRSLPAAKTTLHFVPGQMNNGRAAMHVVRGKGRIAQRREQRSHFALRKFFSRFDRGFACDSCREPLMTRGSSGDPIAGEAVERFSQATLGIEPWMRHRHCVDDEGVAAKSLDLEARSLQILAIGFKRIGLGGAEVQSQWQQQALRSRGPTL